MRFHQVEEPLPDVVQGQVGVRAVVKGVDVEAAWSDLAKDGGDAVWAIGAPGKKMTNLEVGKALVGHG
jgi:hypothetical protein